MDVHFRGSYNTLEGPSWSGATFPAPPNLNTVPAAWISEPRSYDDLATDPANVVGSNGDHRPTNPISSTVHHFDPETGFYLARYRHDRPETGRCM